MARVTLGVVECLERAVLAVCRALDSVPQSRGRWGEKREEDLAFDLAVCVASSQDRFEVAEATARALRRQGLLRWDGAGCRHRVWRDEIREVLATPVRVMRGSRVGQMRTRFPMRTATLLASTIESMRTSPGGLREVLRSASSPQDARAKLMERVSGFGPKQASLFLRRVGYSSELAVLDRHVLDYLRLCHGVASGPSALARIAGYESIEAHFVSAATQREVRVGNFDLAVWVAVRVAKEEGLL